MTARLALFDCDGTLADSQHAIVEAMTTACVSIGVAPPAAQAVRTRIGLSLPAMVAALLPGSDTVLRSALIDAYREAYLTARTVASAQPEPLYDGIIPLLDHLRASGWLLGVATGKSQRGLIRLLKAHGLSGHFITLQTADIHPSKPDPAMIDAALRESGATVDHAVMIGDTAFDMAMAKRAGVRAIGVTWGYHDAPTLVEAGAEHLVNTPDELAEIMP